MSRTRLFLGKLISGTLGWLRTPFRNKEEKKTEVAKPVLEEFFDDASSVVLLGVLEERLLGHVSVSAKRAGLSFRLTNSGEMPSPPPSKQPIVLTEAATAQGVSAWKNALPAARVVQLMFTAKPDTEASLAKLGIDDYLVVPLTPFTIQKSLGHLARPARKPRKHSVEPGNVRLEWLDEAEQTKTALEKSAMSRRKYARKVAMSPAKLDNFVTLASLDAGCKAFLRENAIWFKKAQSLVLLATKLPAEALPVFLREFVERQQRGDDVTLNVAKQMVADRLKGAG